MGSRASRRVGGWVRGGSEAVWSGALGGRDGAGRR